MEALEVNCGIDGQLGKEQRQGSGRWTSRPLQLSMDEILKAL